MQINLYGLCWQSITNSQYLRLCMQGSVLMNSYTGFVECGALCWRPFKKSMCISQVVPPKMDIFVTRKCGSEKLLKNRCTLIVSVSSLFWSYWGVKKEKRKERKKERISQVCREHQKVENHCLRSSSTKPVQTMLRCVELWLEFWET
jgi:hypothetical protein